MTQCITFLTSYDAKPTTKQFAETTYMSREAAKLWADLEGPSNRFVLFAVWWKDGCGVYKKIDRSGDALGNRPDKLTIIVDGPVGSGVTRTARYLAMNPPFPGELEVVDMSELRDGR